MADDVMDPQIPFGATAAEVYGEPISPTEDRSKMGMPQFSNQTETMQSVGKSPINMTEAAKEANWAGPGMITDEQLAMQQLGYTTGGQQSSVIDYAKHLVDKIPSPENGLPSVIGGFKRTLKAFLGASEGVATGDVGIRDVMDLGIGIGAVNVGRAAITGALEQDALKAADSTMGMFYANLPSRPALKDMAEFYANGRQTASTMEKAGKSMMEIYRETGLSKSPEGNYMLELSDKDFKWKPGVFEELNKRLLDNPGSLQEARFGDILEHDMLTKIHPELKDMNIRFERDLKNGSITNGYYRPGPTTADQHININIGHETALDAFGNDLVPSTKDAVLAPLTHELQHYVSAADVAAGVYTGVGSNADVVAREVRNSANYYLPGRFGNDLMHKYDAITHAAKTIMEENGVKFKPGVGDLDIPQGAKDWTAYIHDSGEVVARLAEHRRGLSQEQIMAIHPDHHLDVDKNLIMNVPSRTYGINPNATHLNTGEKAFPGESPVDKLNQIKSFGKRGAAKLSENYESKVNEAGPPVSFHDLDATKKIVEGVEHYHEHQQHAGLQKMADVPDYDYEGAKAAGVQPDERGHYPDTFKLPNHITFSEESKYSTSEQQGGKWSKTDEGKWSFTPGPENYKHHSVDDMKDYFRNHEPDAELNLPSHFQQMGDSPAAQQKRLDEIIRKQREGIDEHSPDNWHQQYYNDGAETPMPSGRFGKAEDIPNFGSFYKPKAGNPHIDYGMPRQRSFGRTKGSA